MTFFSNKNLFTVYLYLYLFREFIDSMQLMNSSPYKLVKNLSDEDFKYLVEEFDSENLELWNQKGDYPYEYLNSFERFNEEKLPAGKYFYSSTKDGKICDDSKISDGHINVKDCLTCEKLGINLKWKIWAIITIITKKRRIVISRCFRKVYCYVFKTLWIRSMLLI